MDFIMDISHFLVSLGKTKLMIFALVVLGIIGSIVGFCIDLGGFASKIKYIILLLISLLAGYMFLFLV